MEPEIIIMRLCELRNKQVINEDDCRIIGYVTDIDIDTKCGCIEAIIVPGPGHLCGLFGRDFEYIIPFRCIKCIGPDAVLVNVCLERVKEKCI